MILKPSVGEHGTVFVTGRDGGPGAVPSVTLSAEHYNMIARYLQQNIPVKLRVNVQTKFYDADGGNAYNVIAELPGTDPALKDEVVMIGGHLDSWHTGVGATDNADGIDDGDGGDADPEGDRRAAAAHHPRRAVGRRRAGAARIEGVGHRAPRRPGQRRRARQVRRLLQHRQRHREDLRLVPAEPGGGPADLRQLARAAEEHRRAPQRRRAGRLHRSSELHRRRRARASIRSRTTATTTSARTTPTWTPTIAST